MIKKLSQVLFITLCACCTSAIYSQNSISEPVPMNKMMIRQWTGDDGLISNNLNSVDQSSDGFLWITSFSGVFRFDGKTFKRFHKENIEGLNTNGFLDLTEGEQGEMIFASQGSGAFEYQKDKVRPVEGLGVSSVRNVLVDRNGQRWYGTTNEGVVIQAGDNLSKVQYDGFERVSILTSYEDKKGTIWFGTGGNGLVRYSQGSFKKFDTDNLLKDNNVAAIAELDTGKLLIGSTNGLYIFSKADGTSTPVRNFENIDVNDIVIDNSGMIWIATEQGLFRINLETGYFEVFNEQNGLPYNKISSIHIDAEGSVWLATRKAGLLRMTQGSITMLNQLDGILNTRINIIYEHKDKTYIGCDDGSVYVKGDNGITPIDLLTKSKNIGIRDFAVTSDGTLLVASYLGLIKYKNGKEQLIAEEDGLPYAMIRRICPLPDGSLWLASRNGGVMHFKDRDHVKSYTNQNGLKSNYILSLEKDNNDDIVVGTYSGGVSIIKKDTTISHIIPGKGSALVFNIDIDKDNNYWLSTNVGIYHFKDGVFTKINLDPSCETETFFDFIDDEKGSLWLTSSYGIMRLKKSEVQDFLQEKLEVVEVEILDNNDGMANKECTGATRSFLNSKGELWVPTIDGIAIVNGDVDRHNTVLPKISITSFDIDGEPVSEGVSHIEPGKMRYLFEFASSSYQAPDKVEFKYQLSGVDKSWVSTKERKIEYTNLFPGTYTFSVIGSNNSGVWNEKGAQVTFTVKPFFYQTWWFYALLAAFIAMIIYLAWVWRVRRIKAMNKKLSKLNEELDRFVYSASHDMRAPLASMLGLVNLAKISESTETKDQCFDMIEKSVGKLDEFIKDIIDYSRNQRTAVVYEEIDVAKELECILDELKYLDEPGKISYRVNSSIADIKTDKRRFGVIMRNIIANAFLYHDGAKTRQFIEIECRLKGDNIEVCVEDNGLGMEKATQKQIFKMFYRGHEDSQGSGLGLYIAKENLEKLNGEVNVDSTLGEGTKFTILLPLHK